MILSKKYIESMNKITMDDELKKRILEKVSQVSEEEINNNVINIQKSKRPNKAQRRFVGVAAACCAFVVCAGLKVKFPELFNINNTSISSNNEMIADNNIEVADNNISENMDKYETSDNNENSYNNEKKDINNSSVNNSVAIDYKPKAKNEEVYSNNIGTESKQKSDVIQVEESNQTYDAEKSTEGSDYKEIDNKSSQNNEQIKSDNTEKIVNDNNKENNNYQENISNNGISVVSENNDGKESSQNDMTKDIVLVSDDENNTSPSKRIANGIPENIENNFKIPEALKEDCEITYSLAVSDDELEVGYKGKEYGEGKLIISSKENTNNDKNYSSVEDVKTSKGNAVIKVSENGKEKYADWKYENKYYSLNTEANVNNEKIIYIIESCK